MVLVALLALPAYACGEGGDEQADASEAHDASSVGVDAEPTAIDAMEQSAPDATTSVLELTSSVMTDGGTYPVKYTCQGDNVSPPLAWTGAPAGTEGFALVVTDITPPALIHSVLWDISNTASSLPENVEKVYEPTNVPGAKQTRAYSPAVRGYLGPCPGSEHTYELRLYAVDEYPLGGVDMNSGRSALVDALENASIQSATITATFDPSNP